MIDSLINGFKKSVRAPILYGLREISWYRQLSGLPTNNVIGIENYLEAVHQANGHHPHTQTLTPIHPASVVSVKPIGYGDGVPAVFNSIKEFATPATFVARLSEQQLFGKGIAIITPDKRLLSEVTVHIGGPITEHCVMKRFNLPKLETVKGTTAVLSTPAGNVFYHWMFDLLPRLELLRLGGVNLSEIDQFAINSTGSRFQRDALALLNIDQSRILETDRHPNILCEEMVLPSFPGQTMQPPRWACDFLVNTVLTKEPPDKVARRKKIYITRRKSPTRHVINQDEIDSFLIKRGFHIVAPEEYDITTQAHIFNRAEVIVAPRGSGLSNLVFCKPGTIVVELFPPSQIDTCFWFLSSQMDLNYYCQAGSGSPGAGSNFIIDVNNLSALFKEIGI